MGKKAGSNHPPFYKFMKAATAEIVLTNGTLRWSTPAAFNDPFDMQFSMELPTVDEALKVEALTKHFESMTGRGPFDPRSKLGRVNAFFAQRLRETGQRLSRAEFDAQMSGSFDEMVANGAALIGDLQKGIESLMREEKVLCLTDRIDSVQQWSHYAEDHRGVALQFVSLADDNSPWSQARQVDYVDEIPLLLTREEFTDFTSGRAILDPQLTLDRIIFSKALEWQNEREWRIATGFGRNRKASFEDIPFNAGELGAVVFGCRIDAAVKKHLTEIVAERFPHAKVLQAGKAEREFAVIVRQAD